ncbi:S-layer homology domain-containing protein [Peribacillus saganii]|uniref:S-layer homology domain-containing protein n=1 Tax=Peribacillus saganii TaxID=2303992 RepID=A0A372LME3_9BACI|nr:S-layer homology domain-containing protein [Peribacillus saganii]RFU68324.1 S-layer homology domain-containing protein [Peribacillus saganii]
MAKSFQKFLTVSATAALVATAVAPAASAEGHTFTDVNDRYDEAVSFLYANGMISGKTSTKFGTGLNLTRGDAAVILANALELDTETAPDAGFKDLNSRVKGAVNALAAEGIISGVTKDTFAPNQLLTRGAMAKFLVTSFGLEDFAEETPFTDVGGVFAPYIEALYGTGITSGKTPSKYGTYIEITRGDFANLLYNTIMFVEENIYFAVAESAAITNSKTLTVTLDEAVPQEFTAQDAADTLYLGVEYKDGTVEELIPSKATLSNDRKTLTFEHKDLAGKEGTLWIDDVELAFDHAAPVAGAGTITLEGGSAVNFDFAGKNTASATLPATNGIANLNGIVLNVADSSFTANQTVNVILKSTDVEAAKSAEGKPWGVLELKNGKWNLVDKEIYNFIPTGNYTFEAQFKDSNNNATNLTFDFKVGE